MQNLIDKLDALGTPVDRETAARWLQESQLTLADVVEHVAYLPDLYGRRTVKRTDRYELLVVSWASGQWSTLHDHTGSICAFRVVEGTATEIHFDVSSAGYLYPAETLRHGPGQVQSCTGADVHQLCNLEQEGLISVHIYSPPLTASQSYPLARTPFAGYPELVQRVKNRASLTPAGRA